MIGHYPHGNIGSFRCTISYTRFICNKLNERHKNIRIIVGGFALQHPHQALKAHAGVHVAGGQRLQRAILQAVKLHKHNVPNLNYLVVIAVYQRPAIHGGYLLIGTAVVMYFRAGAAGASFAHLPKIIPLAAGQNMAFIDILFPVIPGFLVLLQTFPFIALKNGDIQAALIYPVNPGQQFPAPGNGLLFKVIAKAPVAQHFKHGMVVGIYAYFL